MNLQTTRQSLRCFAAAALAVSALAAVAEAKPSEELRGRVVRIIDGDTVSLLDANSREHRLRLAVIDAPEKAQPFGSRAKQTLSELCFGRQARATVTERDRYGRGVAHLVCSGTDANEAMVRKGKAWVFRRYAPATSGLLSAEQQARAERRGLWSDPSPTAPWVWRRQSRGQGRQEQETEGYVPFSRQRVSVVVSE